MKHVSVLRAKRAGLLCSYKLNTPLLQNMRLYLYYNFVCMYLFKCISLQALMQHNVVFQSNLVFQVCLHTNDIANAMLAFASHWKMAEYLDTTGGSSSVEHFLDRFDGLVAHAQSMPALANGLYDLRPIEVDGLYHYVVHRLNHLGGEWTYACARHSVIAYPLDHRYNQHNN